MSRPVRIDWFRVYVDLDRAGYGLRRVALTLNVPYPTLQFQRNYEAEPRHSTGDAVVRLWCEVMGRTRDELPTMRKPMSVSAAKR